MMIRATVQIEHVVMGSIGGAIFTGIELKSDQKVRCVADHNVLTREPVKGEFFYVEGIHTNHRDYGKQVRVSKCQPMGIPSPIYINRFLSKHPVFRGFGLGKQKIDKLIASVGDEKKLVELLDGRNTALLSTYLSEPIALELCNRWDQISEETELLHLFIEHKIPHYLFPKVNRVFKYDVVNRIRANPYSLLAFFPSSKSIWQVVDNIAKKLGFARDSEQRLIGATEFLLYQKLDNGSTAIPKVELLLQLRKLIKSSILPEKAIQTSCLKKAICSFQSSDGTHMFQSLGAAVIESSLEKHVRALVAKPLEIISGENIVRLINELDSSVAISLTTEQLAAVRLAVNSRISVITGFGGSGKTTVIKMIAKIAERLGRLPVLAALAGKAKQRIEDVTGLNGHCFTIHGAIEAINSNRLARLDNEEFDKKFMVIIDEASMVDIALANRLLNVLSGKNYQLLLVGDCEQLSPVGFGLFFHALVGHVPTSYLTQVHRQAEDSQINQMAMWVRGGQSVDVPEWDGQREGVYFVCCDNNQNSIIRAIGNVLTQVPCQIISPHSTERMQDNVHSLNRAMQFLMNLGITNDEHDVWEIDRKRPIFRVGNTGFLENDPVIVTRNNHKLSLFNGSSGVIKRITTNDYSQPSVEVTFEKGEHVLTKEQCLELGLQLAYAISVHKSQGSEYESVIVSCAVKSSLLDRSLVYTALTRSKKLVVFVGSKEVLSSAIRGKPRHLEITHGLSI